jgi:hypothetical protein
MQALDPALLRDLLIPQLSVPAFAAAACAQAKDESLAKVETVALFSLLFCVLVARFLYLTRTREVIKVSAAVAVIYSFF